MSPEARRIVIPVVVAIVALLVVLAMVFSQRRAAPPTPAVPSDAPAEVPPIEPPIRSQDEAAIEPAGDPQIAAPGAEEVSLQGLRPVAPLQGVRGHEVPPATLGSLNPEQAPLYIEFSRAGAGMARITSSRYWDTVGARQQAERHWRDPAGGPPLPPDELRYVLAEHQPLGGIDVPVLATHSIMVNGQRVFLFDYTRDPETDEVVFAWSETAPGRFETIIVNEDRQPILRIVRRYTLGAQYDILLAQRVENVSAQPLEVRWQQYGPGDLTPDRGGYIDRRRARFGYVLDPARPTIVSADTSLIFERPDLFKKFDPATHFTLWPNPPAQRHTYVLSWFAMTSRYFAVAVHPVVDEQGRGPRTFEHLVEEIQYQLSHPDHHAGSIFTHLISPVQTLEPGETLALDLGVFAGPMDRNVLGEQPYLALGMDQLILYMMSTFCAICTFQWLAHWLIAFLAFLHDWLLFDWGLAIIGLVVVVRLILHPITKKAQINMMRFGKQMQAMKPEIDKLQKKFDQNTKEGRQKLQQEQLQLMREHGINPFQLLGCLPMFLQFPIWIALYAMLYFAFDIRHEPAFFGVFQWMTAGAWPFLADLSTGDHFFGEFAEPKRFLGFPITGLNALPILMGIVLYIHQKYMTPPPSATMTPEQIQQQKIMRVMMVVMLPVFLYPAPAGLTLYIITSSMFGIVESKYIRSHVDQMDLGPDAAAARGPGQPKPKPKKPDRIGRAYADALDAAKKKRKPPPPSFKKRK